MAGILHRYASVEPLLLLLLLPLTCHLSEATCGTLAMWWCPQLEAAASTSACRWTQR
jgi:hypothetical protein